MNQQSATANGGDVWAPGVFNSFLREITKSPDSVAGGVFVGRFTDGLRIEGLIATVESGRASAVVLDNDSWDWISGVWREFYSTQSLVGWYCSRPGLGAVPTERDVATHQKFFQNNQALLVSVDPTDRSLVGYVIADNGLPVEIVRGQIDEAIYTQQRMLPSGQSANPNLIRWAVASGGIVGLAAFLITGASGWPFA